ncbi:MAG: hypothetical protein Kow0067_17750 [Coriobacteriia bacterium]
MVLFLQLYVGHLLGDFVFQPGRLVLAKRRGTGGLALHTLVVVACTALVMLGSLRSQWPAALIAGIAHAGIEPLTIRARNRTAASGLSLFLLDQALHVVSLVLVALVLPTPARSVLIVWDVTPGTLAGIAGIGTVAFFGSILAFEARMVAGAPMQSVIGLDAHRLYGMAERSVALGVALVSPLPALGLLAFGPRFVYALAGGDRRRATALLDVAVGMVLCVLVWGLLALYVRVADATGL